ncbi:hypothetical protein M3P05_16665 [Sansalvadorimonas sp. 2012CJ34-2]|uniref:RING-type domain-containing protein n=1 Tax=Parendozoicomonas callyspongiae TaxID=2942213 RepID=A0ABT0PJH9_9GAMM|nr:hypothetical protein [Sansalvadorimonas sp. 2012CJ34-2]MCL6271550.1 hypothetical protein [Sansalvadorimonas sp. 2012CJ34-2]
MGSPIPFCRLFRLLIPATLILFTAITSAAEEPADQEISQPQPSTIQNSSDVTPSRKPIIRYGKLGSTLNLDRHTIYLEGITADDTEQAINSVLWGGIASSALINLGYIGLHLFSQPYIFSPTLAPLVAFAGAAGQSLWYYYRLLNFKQAATAGFSYFIPLLVSQSPHVRLYSMFPGVRAEDIPYLPRAWSYLFSLGLLPFEILLNAMESYVEDKIAGDVQLQLKGEVSQYFIIRARFLTNGAGFYILERMPQTQPEEYSTGYQKLARVLEEQNLTVITLLPYTHKGANKLKVLCFDKQTGTVAKINLRGDLGQENAPWLLTSIARSSQSDNLDHSSGVHSLLARDVIENVADAIKAFTDRDKGDEGYNSENFDEREPKLYEYSITGTDIGFLPQISKAPLRRLYGSNSINEINGQITWDTSGMTTQMIFDDGIPSEDVVQWRIPDWLGNSILSEFIYWSQEAGYYATSRIFRTASNITGLTDFMHNNRRESAQALYQTAHDSLGINEQIFTLGMRAYTAPFTSIHEDYINQSPMYREVDTTPPMPYPTGVVNEGAHCFRCTDEIVNPDHLRLTSCCGRRICQPCLSNWVFNDNRNRFVNRDHLLWEFSVTRSQTIQWNCSHCWQPVQGRVTRWRTVPSSN